MLPPTVAVAIIPNDFCERGLSFEMLRTNWSEAAWGWRASGVGRKLIMRILILVLILILMLIPVLIIIKL